MELYIIRHGQTVWNAEKRTQGRKDIELNAYGRQLAGELGEKLENVPFDCIYASPLIRAYETACLIRGHRNIPIIRDGHLKEMSFGVMEGTRVEEWLESDCPYRFFFDEPERYAPPEGGESIEEVMARTSEFLQEVIEQQYETATRLMIVAHGALNKGLMCRIEGNDKAHFWGKGLQKNCEADIFHYDGMRWHIGPEAI